MNIVLVRPPAFSSSSAYPYNIDCIATALINDGHSVYFVDAEKIAARAVALSMKEGAFNKVLNIVLNRRKAARQQEHIRYLFEGATLWDEIADRILAHNPEMVGFSCYSSSMSSIVKITEALRKRNYDNLVVLGGIHPTSLPEETLYNVSMADVIVIGEGERVICELASAVSRKEELHNVSGLCYRSNGEIKMTAPNHSIPDLSSLPVPRFSFARDEHYGDYVLLTSRGCPFTCDFCASNVIFGRKVRYKSPDVVADELENLINRTETKYVRFGDDTFTLNRKHMQGVSDQLKKRNISLKISVGSRIDTIDREKLNILKSMGVNHISFGIETGSERLQKSTNKKISIDDVVPTVKMVNDAGIHTLTFFIINHPEETADDLNATYVLIKRLIDECSLNVIELNTGFPYPRTPWWDYCIRKGLDKQIDFYRLSHTYSHQSSPIVNMTVEDEATLHRYVIQMEKLIQKNRLKNNLKRAFSNPYKAINRIRQEFLN